MKSSHLITILLVLIFHLSGISFSYFSSAKEGIGYHEYVPSVRGLGMGGTGLALPDSVSLNAYNIATWRHIKITRISILMRLDYNQTNLASQSFSSNTGKFGGIQLAVPLKRDKVAFGLSITPYTFVNFGFSHRIENELGSYEENVFFEGDLSRSQLNFSWSPHPNFGIGVSFNYFFGSIQDRYKLIFDEQAFYNTVFRNEYRFHGPGLGSSFDWKLFNSLRLGGFLDLKPKIKFTKVFLSPLDFQEEEVTEDGSLPLFWGIGSSYQLSHRWLITADYAAQKWSEGFELSGVETKVLDDWYRAGFGIERAHSKKRTAVFLNKIDIRAGISISQIGYLFNDESVQEYTGHFGLGIPFFQNRARLDFGFLAGIRGDKQKNLAEEKFFRVFISLSAGELWFQKLR